MLQKLGCQRGERLRISAKERVSTESGFQAVTVHYAGGSFFSALLTACRLRLSPDRGLFLIPLALTGSLPITFEPDRLQAICLRWTLTG